MQETKRCGFDPWFRKIPWNRNWQPTPVFLPGKFHGQRSLVGYSPRGHKESDRTEQFKPVAPTTNFLRGSQHFSGRGGQGGVRSSFTLSLRVMHPTTLWGTSDFGPSFFPKLTGSLPLGFLSLTCGCWNPDGVMYLNRFTFTSSSKD